MLLLESIGTIVFGLWVMSRGTGAGDSIMLVLGLPIELSLPNGIEGPRRSNCSICSRRGAISASVPLDSLKVLSCEDKLPSILQVGPRIAARSSARRRSVPL